MPLPGEKLEKPLMDVSTKLEATDRYLPWKEAQELAKLNNEELDQLKSCLFPQSSFCQGAFHSLELQGHQGLSYYIN